VLLHGIGSNAVSFAGLFAVLPGVIDPIAWDAPGYGESEPLAPANPSPRDYADALARLFDALGLTRATLVGHSLGALFSASFAAHHSDRVQALALVSPAVGYGVGPGCELPPGVQARIDEITELGPRAFAAKRAARLVANPSAKPEVVASVEAGMAAVRPSGYIQAVRALGAGKLLDDAPRVRAKTTVVVGAEDQITPPANAQAVYGALLNPAGYHEIANAGHALPQEIPKALSVIVADLVKGTS
jgi:pimeloyl-ACP methyl ester carboxylesterase